jgi:hypothetical protein
MALIGVVALSGIALAAKPEPLGNYGGKHVSLQADSTGKSLSSFDGDCTAVKHPKFSFAVFFGIPVNGQGKFSWNRKNAVNTPNGGTLSQTYRVTINGQFVSKKEAKGTYQLHKRGCKTVTFDAKLMP